MKKGERQYAIIEIACHKSIHNQNWFQSHFSNAMDLVVIFVHTLQKAQHQIHSNGQLNNELWLYSKVPHKIAIYNFILKKKEMNKLEFIAILMIIKRLPIKNNNNKCYNYKSINGIYLKILIHQKKQTFKWIPFVLPCISWFVCNVVFIHRYCMLINRCLPRYFYWSRIQKCDCYIFGGSRYWTYVTNSTQNSSNTIQIGMK